jgi:organic radical activating enzyme
MQINEYFLGFQGEGRNQGKHSLFIRFNLCNLSCKNCDSKYTWKIGNSKEVEIDELKSFVFNNNVDHIVFTGGEPLLPKNLRYIKTIIREFPLLTTEIETNGTITLCESDVEFFNKYETLFNISPKQNFEQIGKRNTSPIFILRHRQGLKVNNYIVKFLINSKEDIDYIIKIQKEFNISNKNIYVQPKAVTKRQVLKILKKYYNDIIHYGWNISFRTHVLMFNKKKGV